MEEKMKKYTLSILLVFCPIYALAGFSITEENDVLRNKDNNYTQGAEISLIDYLKNTNKISYGARSRMYTPQHIQNPTNQPNDRPWACITTLFFDKWTTEYKETVKYGVELGVLGPWAFGKCQQTTIHRWIDSPIPKGWGNQVPNELALNAYMLRYHHLTKIGKSDALSLNLDIPYGITLGTTYDNLQIGKSIKTGWNIPSSHLDDLNEGINPKGYKPNERPFIYLLGNFNEKYVAHNATLGHSFFTNKDKWDRNIKPFVSEWHYGACVGYKNIALSYILDERSLEFKRQPELMRWATIKIEWTASF
jgi:lipid A 3-O-deacylase